MKILLVDFSAEVEWGHFQIQYREQELISYFDRRHMAVIDAVL
jgi:hypothetical protein